jgi:hypothetical protein
MLALLKWIGIVLAVYFVSWCAAWFLMFALRGDDLNFQYFFQYLGAAWSFSAGELAAFIWLGSLVIFFVLLGVLLLVRKLFARRRHNAVF